MKILFTGGGTAGHVMPNIAIIDKLQKKYGGELDTAYIGSIDGIERGIIEKRGDIAYYPIKTGKLRRYFSLKNLTDPFRVIAGYGEAKKIVKKLRPDCLFSKGGFVSVPVVLACKHYHIPIVSHESDMTPGLANKISSRYADSICVTFPETVGLLSGKNTVLTGSPVRLQLYTGSAKRGREFAGFDSKRVITVMGGSIGSKIINAAVRDALGELTKKYNIVHLCGKGNIDETLKDMPSYRQYEFLSVELNDVLAMTDFMISRAGSNAIHEFLALKKPMLLIPLSMSASRGDQIQNARSFTKRGFATTLDEEKMNKETLLKSIAEIEGKKNDMVKSMEAFCSEDAVDNIISVIEKAIV